MSSTHDKLSTTPKETNYKYKHCYYSKYKDVPQAPMYPDCKTNDAGDVSVLSTIRSWYTSFYSTI